MYPDVIESGTADAATIKSHHNVGGLPRGDGPRARRAAPALFKDEVRAIGEELGLPAEMVWRQPFPGPGLAVRVVGEVTPERVEILRAADEIVLEEIRRDGLDKQLWQWFAVLPAVRTVGVMGDERTYGYPIVVRAVTSEDAMTADWARLPYDVLERISSRVINEVPRSEPRRLRRDVQAPGNDRVGVMSALLEVFRSRERAGAPVVSGAMSSLPPRAPGAWGADEWDLLGDLPPLGGRGRIARGCTGRATAGGGRGSVRSRWRARDRTTSSRT